MLYTGTIHMCVVYCHVNDMPDLYRVIRAYGSRVQRKYRRSGREGHQSCQINTTFKTRSDLSRYEPLRSLPGLPILTDSTEYKAISGWPSQGTYGGIRLGRCNIDEKGESYTYEEEQFKGRPFRSSEQHFQEGLDEDEELGHGHHPEQLG